MIQKDGEKRTKKGLENDWRREWASKIFYFCLTPHLMFSSSPSSPLLFFLSSLFSFSFSFFTSFLFLLLFSYLHSFFSCPLSFSFFLFFFFFPAVNVTSSVGLATFFLFIAQVFISSQKLNYPFLDIILNFTVYFNYYFFI